MTVVAMNPTPPPSPVPEQGLSSSHLTAARTLRERQQEIMVLRVDQADDEERLTDLEAKIEAARTKVAGTVDTLADGTGERAELLEELGQVQAEVEELLRRIDEIEGIMNVRQGKLDAAHQDIPELTQALTVARRNHWRTRYEAERGELEARIVADYQRWCNLRRLGNLVHMMHGLDGSEFATLWPEPMGRRQMLAQAAQMERDLEIEETKQ